MKQAFTLIELLIVVAIIAILAAIAVPNFLEARTRAQVSRVKSDMRTLATGIEAYTVDNNRPPMDWAEDAGFPYYIHRSFTTPISYVSGGARMTDPFAPNLQGGFLNTNAVRERFRHRAFGQEYLTSAGAGPFNLPGPNGAGNRRALEIHGAWFLSSKGPTGTDNPLPAGFADGNNQNDWLWLLYDPTNGTISLGNILRSQARSDVNSTGYGDINVTYNPPPANF